MLIRRLQEFDTKLQQRPEVKILVYFAAIMALAAIPYVVVVYQGRIFQGHPGAFDCTLEGIGAAAAVGALFLMRSTPGALPIASYGYRARGIVSQTALGAGIGLAIMSAIMNILRATDHYTIESENHHFAPVRPLVLFLFVAIFEETIFRGYVFTTLEQKWGSFVALTTTCLFFGLSHLLDPIPGMSFGQHLRAALFIGLEAGLLMNAAYMLTRTLWLGIGIHWAWNFFEGPFYGTSVSGMDDTQSLYIAHTTGSTLITGGGFGPENGLVCLGVGTLVGIVMLILAIRAGQWKQNPDLVST